MYNVYINVVGIIIYYDRDFHTSNYNIISMVFCFENEKYKIVLFGVRVYF